MVDQVIANRYKVIGKIGFGATAVVYKVKDLSLGNTCALKKLKIEQPRDDQLIRFQREAQAVSGLRHQNLVSMLDFGMDEANMPYLVMDYVEGSTLRQYLKKNGAPSVEESILIIEQICDAIAHIHNQNVLHRDLKASNFMIEHSKNGPKIKLLDFGLAKGLAEDMSADLTKAGISLGTPTYMSPEQAQGKEVDQRSDIYSLGCLFFEILTGSVPLKGATVMDTMKMQIAIEPPTVQSKVEEVIPEELEEIVAKCLKKNPDERFSNIKELRESIATMLQDSPTSEEEDLPSQPEFQSTSLGPKFFVFLTVFILLGIIVFAYSLSRESEDPVKMMDRHTKTARSIVADYIGDYLTFKGECDILWSAKSELNDKEVLQFTAENTPDYLSLCRHKTITTKGLAHAAKIPFQGLGLNKRNLTGEQLSLFARPDSKLKVLYIQDNPAITDSDLVALQNLKDLKLLTLTEDSITDDGLKSIARLKSLETLKLNNMRNFDGSGIKYLEAMPNLKRLCVSRNKLSDQAWDNIAKLKNLEVLAVASTNLDTAKLKKLTEMNLRRLDVSKNPLRNDDLELLKEMKSLEMLRLYACVDLSRQAIAKLMNERPDCRIETYRRKYKLDGDPVLVGEKL